MPASADGRLAARVISTGAGPQCGCRDLRVDAALEAFGRLGRQLVPAHRAADPGRVEVGGLQQHLGGGAGDLGGRAAHHAGQPDRAAVVGDHQVVRVEGANDAVQGGELLPRFGRADLQAALQQRPVVTVQRLAGLEHHVVGHVDRERDGPHAAGPQPVGDECRSGRGRIEAGHRAHREPRAACRVHHPDRIAVAVRLRSGHRDVGERHLQRHRGLAGQAAHR